MYQHTSIRIFFLISLCLLRFDASLDGYQVEKDADKQKDQPKDHWAFEAIIDPPLPDAIDGVRYENEIDYFIQDVLNAKGLTPSIPASPYILVRRIYLDLIGLPPTPEQTDSFVNSAKSDLQSTVENLVDRLLKSPQYGERWGRHWLDVARFSDGFGGFQDSAAMPHAWRFRDWVVQALNEDLPYDEFLKYQIAGDLIGSKPTDKIATGFFALGPTYRSDGGDPDSVAQAKSETLEDRVDTLTRGMLGLTVSCARCHDHLFDPIPQLDYYSLAGVFNNSTSRVVPISKPEVVNAFNDFQNRTKQLKNNINNLNKTIRKEKREATKEEQSTLAQWDKEKKELEQNPPPRPDEAHALVDTGNADMHLAKRGNLRKPGELAPRRFLQVLSNGEPKEFNQGSGRIQLAEAVASPDNPLTARVMVNRVWKHHFGKALVRTPSNFGDLGELPTHPKLLDWLSIRFMESGWSMKQLHKTIMTSAAYQMSSQHRDEAFDLDGDNKFIWRMNPRRMEAEVWRDTLLHVSGELDMTLGGQPTDKINTPRRSIYFKVSRNGDRFESDNYLRLFDFPLMKATVPERPESIVPQQFLFLMNSPFMKNRASVFSEKMRKSSPNNMDRINLAYRILYGRNPSRDEVNLGIQYLTSYQSDNSNSSDGQNALWDQYAQVLLSSNELMYVR